MYNIFRILIGVPDYSRSSFFGMKRELSPPPPDKQNTPGILYRNTNTTGKKINKTSSWHLNRFPDAENIGYTV